MWSVFQRLSGHTAACWFCHETTKLAPTTDTHDWFCTRCQNHNTLDAAGNIVDARAEMYQEAPTARRPVPVADAAPQAFCTTCQRNQELVRQILASYLPDEDDPEHASRVAGADEYARALRRRYPLVCRACQRTVDQRLQEQAQWLCRRQLAGALARSSERVLGPHTLLPSLRRKPVVVTWIACAIVALIGCPLATWAWYYYMAAEAATRSASDWRTTACVGFALAALTYMARWLNPLWLYVAYNPGVRVAGLALYKRRLVRLAVVRGCAALLQPQHWVLWVLVGSYDVALTVLAFGSVCTRTGKRQQQQQQQQQRHCDDSARSETARASGAAPLDLPLRSFESMSFGPSETNMDQDDSFWGASLADPPPSRSAWLDGGQHQQPEAGSSGDETNTEIMFGLDTLTFESPLRQKGAFSRKQSAEAMDVDVRAPALSNRRNITDQLLLHRRQTNSRAYSDVSGPRPFEAFKFHRDVPTGLESKLSAFSIDDDDDGSYQGPFGSSAMDLRLLDMAPYALVLRMCLVGCVVGSWFSAWMHAAWLMRITLVAALLCVAARKWMSLTQQSGPGVKGVAWAAGAGLLLAALIGIPVLYALHGLDGYPSVVGIPNGEQEGPGIGAPHVAHWWPSVLVRWLQARPLVGHSLWCFLDARRNTACIDRRSLPPLVRLDWSAEATALLYIALV
ncbi:hypothetical protein GGI23_004310 [Coemansia sp. RSA 2559]|nr:hypothetical protein GGI23_004310 [Coemansia sp. RSA 2559]KAJ2859510.1 hypothetical protein GGI22_002966 [Coemansia erecta]